MRAAPLLRAALGGAVAMAVFGTVEIWFTELTVWAFHRSAFAPLEGRFAVALFVLYPLAGAAAGALLAGAAQALGLAVDSRAVGALAVLAVHALFRLSAFAGGSLVLLASLNAILLAIAVALAGGAGRGGGARFAALVRPWATALLLSAPPWVMTDLLADAARPVRALGFIATAGAIAAAALAARRTSARPVWCAAASGIATVATLSAVAWARPDSPRQAASYTVPAGERQTSSSSRSTPCARTTSPSTGTPATRRRVSAASPRRERFTHARSLLPT